MVVGLWDTSEAPQSAREKQLRTRQRPENPTKQMDWKKKVVETILVKYLKTSFRQWEFHLRTDKHKYSLRLLMMGMDPSKQR